MRNDVLDSVVKDLLSIPPLIRRSIHRKVFRTVFAQIEEDISLPHFEIMKVVKETGMLHIAEIGERLQIPKPQMTHLIDRLVNLGIVERQADTADRRIINIVLTEKGRRMVEDNDRLIRDGVKEKLSRVTSEELQDLSVSLRRLRDILSKLGD
jgi:DNA-binding MarR family transcriptional regulator